MNLLVFYHLKFIYIYNIYKKKSMYSTLSTKSPYSSKLDLLTILLSSVIDFSLCHSLSTKLYFLISNIHLETLRS